MAKAIILNNGNVLVVKGGKSASRKFAKKLSNRARRAIDKKIVAKHVATHG
jgi:hypothetical protein